MSTTGSAQGFGFEAWIQPFREAMAAFQPSAWPNGAMPGAAWPGAGVWSGQPMGQMPGMGSAAAGMFSPGMAGPFAGMFEQLSTLAQGQWQQLAGQFSSAGTGDVMSQWRRLLETMAPAVAGFDASALQRGAALRDALSTPAIGPLREHVERWQKAMLAQLDYQDAAQAFSAQLGEIMKLALADFERRLSERGPSGQPPASMRALFDEWIEAGEKAWAERAGSDAFVAALGRYTNAQLRVRAAMADQVNRMAESLGLPTRGEVDADHRRIAMLERELRRLRGELDALRHASAHTTEAAVQTAAEVQKPRVVPIRPEAAADNVEAAPARPSRAKVGKKPKVEKSAKHSGKRTKTPKAGRSSVSATVLPIVAAPRAMGAAGRRDEDAAPRRRAGK